MKPKDLFPIICRPALPKDTCDVIKFTREIWEGEDYIPHVWDKWLKDYKGFLAVAECGGKTVGIGRITQLSSDEWWLEGLRVHPKQQGRGIASHLHHYILNCWERNGNGVVRLGTSSNRHQIHHLCKHYGFRKIAELSLYKAATIAEQVNTFTSLKSNEIKTAVETIINNSLTQVSHGLMDHGWKWSRPLAAHFREAIMWNRAWWWQERLGLIVYRDEWEGQLRYPLIQLIACPWDSLVNCLMDYRRKGAITGHEYVGWLAPLHPELQLVLEAAGFERTWDDSLIIYEKVHAKFA